MYARKVAASTRRLVLGLAVVALMLASPALALAANASWRSVDLTLVQGQSGQPTLLVFGQLPADATLPANVSLAVPVGAKVGWAGEILGGDPSKDPSVKYTVKTGKAYDLVGFALTTSRKAQVEVGVPASVVAKGASTQATIDVVAPVGMPSSTLLIQLPTGATVTSKAAGATVVTDATGTWYKRVITGISKGDRLKLTVAYTGGTPVGAGATSPVSQPAATPPAAPGSPASPLLVISVLGLLVSLTFVLTKRLSPEFAAAHVVDDAGDDLEDDEPDEYDDEPEESDDVRPAHECGPDCACGSDSGPAPVKSERSAKPRPRRSVSDAM